MASANPPRAKHIIGYPASSAVKETRKPVALDLYEAVDCRREIAMRHRAV
jgi:hypothetical protein